MITKKVAQKLVGVLEEIPVANLVPLSLSVIKDIPKAWETLPEEKKQEVLQNLIVAGAKAAAGGKVEF